MRAQGYDGAASMSRIHRGVQARIRERIPTALYVHCNAHVLNLAIVLRYEKVERPAPVGGALVWKSNEKRMRFLTQ
jgi:hypothetical protein